MQHWYPERIIRKNFIRSKKEFHAPLLKIRSYAVSNFLKELTPAELNLIRFTYPEVSHTDFPVTADPQVKLSEDELKTAEKILAEGLQVSYVWKKSSGEAVVFCGSFKPKFKDWQLLFAGIVPAEEYNSHIVNRFRTPENFETPVSAAEKALFPSGKKAESGNTDRATAQTAEEEVR